MKFLFVGDLHGKLDIFKKITDFSDREGYTLVQIGDLVDSPKYSNNEQHQLIEYCIERKRTKGDIYLLGNHDLSYISPNHHRCSGFNVSWQPVFNLALKELDQQPYFIVDNVLVTHAGLHPWHLTNNNESYDINEINDILTRYTNNIYHDIFSAGVVRGGSQLYGGITWLDWNFEFQPVLGIHQIVGHTNTKNISIREEKDSLNFNIDCLEFKTEVLEYDTDTEEFKIINI